MIASHVYKYVHLRLFLNLPYASFPVEIPFVGMLVIEKGALKIIGLDEDRGQQGSESDISEMLPIQRKSATSEALTTEDNPLRPPQLLFPSAPEEQVRLLQEVQQESKAMREEMKEMRRELGSQRI